MYSDVHLKMQSNHSNLKTKTELYSWSFREETKFSLKKEYRCYYTSWWELDKIYLFLANPRACGISSVPRPGMETMPLTVEALEKISMKQCYNRFKKSKAVSKELTGT